MCTDTQKKQQKFTDCVFMNYGAFTDRALGWEERVKNLNNDISGVTVQGPQSSGDPRNFADLKNHKTASTTIMICMKAVFHDIK